VKATKKFLDEHPEELKKLSVYRRLNAVGANVVCAFLGWPERQERKRN
jgi:hypothetical protein